MGKHHRKDQQEKDIDIQAGKPDQDGNDRPRRVVNVAPPGSIVGIQSGGDVHGNTVHISRGQR